MDISIQTTANNGHLILLLINSSGVTILTLRDSDKGDIMLVPGQTYRFEWHVWSATAADYEIDASVAPASHGFPPFNWKKSYPNADTDMGGFYFTL